MNKYISNNIKASKVKVLNVDFRVYPVLTYDWISYQVTVFQLLVMLRTQ